MTVARGQLKAARRQLSTLTRLLADLDDRLEAETTGQPEEAHRDGSNEDDE